MAEPGVRSLTYRAGAPMRFGEVTLLPVERSVVHAARAGAGLWCWCTRVPHALLIRDGSGLRAVDANGAPLDPDRLRALLPDLDALLPSP